MDKILILGNGGHARSLIDAIERENIYKIGGLVTNEKNVDDRGYPVIGSDDDLERIYQCGIENAAVGIGYLGKSDLRENIYLQLKEIGFNLPVVCDPSAIVSKRARIGEGSFIGKGAIINAGVSIGKMCIINSGAIIEHDCNINDFSHISVASVVCGGVSVGKASFIGANATIIQMKTIGERCIIGAGTVIKSNVNNRATVHNSKITKQKCTLEDDNV